MKKSDTVKHAHKYETISRHGITSELMEMGLEAVEIRRCQKCRKEIPFILTKKGEWVPLFDDRKPDDEDILLA